MIGRRGFLFGIGSSRLHGGRKRPLAPAHSRPLCFSNLSRMASYMTMFLLNQALAASVLSAE